MRLFYNRSSHIKTADGDVRIHTYRPMYKQKSAIEFFLTQKTHITIAGGDRRRQPGQNTNKGLWSNSDKREQKTTSIQHKKWLLLTVWTEEGRADLASKCLKRGREVGPQGYGVSCWIPRAGWAWKIKTSNSQLVFFSFPLRAAFRTNELQTPPPPTHTQTHTLWS